MNKFRLGIFGGTFSPPHIGHIAIAELFSEQLALDKLLIIPDYLPPHKEEFGNVGCNDRLEMCKIAFSHIKNAEISDMEIKRGGKSYTSDTLQELYSDDTEIFLLMGTDMFLTLDEWHEPEKIFSLANIVCVRRENYASLTVQIDKKSDFFKKKYKARIILLENIPVIASSTEIREEILSGKPDKITKEINDYIIERKLYFDK